MTEFYVLCIHGNDNHLHVTCIPKDIENIEELWDKVKERANKYRKFTWDYFTCELNKKELDERCYNVFDTKCVGILRTYLSNPREVRKFLERFHLLDYLIQY